MNTTINISLPTSMYKDAKKAVAKQRYSSISEIFRAGLRKILYPQLTENGFTPEFEEAVLRSAAEPLEEGYLLKTDEDFENYFKHLILPKKRYKPHAKSDYHR